MKTAIAAPLWLALGVICGGAAAQGSKPEAPAAIACPADARELPLQALYGRWEARFDGLPGVATVQLSPHPDYAGVRGTITRAGNGGTPPASTAQLAGDVDDEGALSIDESLDGRTISGVWSGTLQAGSCGREFRGTWRDAADESTRPFVLSKIDGPEGKQ